MKRLPKIFAILTIGLMLSSVSYAGSDASPGDKATKIESTTMPMYVCEANFQVSITALAPQVTQEQVTENVMIVKNCEALPVTGVKPTAVKRRWRSDESNRTTNYDIKRSPVQPDKFDSTKFRDKHRRLCNAG